MSTRSERMARITAISRSAVRSASSSIHSPGTSGHGLIMMLSPSCGSSCHTSSVMCGMIGCNRRIAPSSTVHSVHCTCRRRSGVGCR